MAAASLRASVAAERSGTVRASPLRYSEQPDPSEELQARRSKRRKLPSEGTQPKTKMLRKIAKHFFII